MGEVVKRIACWFKGHDPDPLTYLFDGTGKTMCRRCWAVVPRPRRHPQGRSEVVSVELKLSPKTHDRREWRYWTGDPKSWWDRNVMQPKLELWVVDGGWLTIRNEGFVVVAEIFASDQWNTVTVTREADDVQLFPAPKGGD